LQFGQDIKQLEQVIHNNALQYLFIYLF